MADPVQDSLFREIDEDLRQERYAKLWKAYGKYLAAAAVALVLSVAGYQGWRAWDTSTRSALGERFDAAQRLARGDQTEAAARAFAELAADSSGGYALLARFQEAALLAKRGGKVAAAGVYRVLAEDSGVGALYRDLAVVLGALLEMDGPDPGALTRRLAPLTADDNPWRHSAREITAILAHRGGDRAKAKALFVGIAADPSAPQGMRRRAAEMLAILEK